MIRVYDSTLIELSPAITTSAGGTLEARIQIQYPGVYEVYITAEIDGFPVSFREYVELDGVSFKPAATSVRYELNGVDITRFTRIFQYQHGRFDSSGIMKTAAGKGQILIQTDAEIVDLIGQELVVFFGQDQRYATIVSDAKITHDAELSLIHI